MRPVEAMRREAEAISAERLERRLPVSPARDELRRLGHTLNAMLDRLAAGLERERAFTADAGHELRTPLTLMKTRLELIAETHPSGANLDDALRETLDDADRMKTLLDDLLALARLESDRIAVRARDVSAAELLQRTADRYGPLVDPGVINVEAPAHLMVHADPDRVDQALGNMMDNAIRHGRPPIELTAEARGDGVLLHVRDRGRGFSDGLAGRAFERFVQGGTEGGGAGLGLAIVELVARSHGGSAGASARRGGGADVWIELPGGPSPVAFRQRSGAPTSIDVVPADADHGYACSAAGTSKLAADLPTPPDAPIEVLVRRRCPGPRSPRRSA
jgi:signal transduction histidine kinase